MAQGKEVYSHSGDFRRAGHGEFPLLTVRCLCFYNAPIPTQQARRTTDVGSLCYFLDSQRMHLVLCRLDTLLQATFLRISSSRRKHTSIRASAKRWQTTTIPCLAICLARTRNFGITHLDLGSIRRRHGSVERQEIVGWYGHEGP